MTDKVKDREAETMDSLLLAGQAIALLEPFFRNIGAAIAKKVGEDIYDFLKGHFDKQKDKSGQKLLENARQEPSIYLKALNDYLAALAESNEEFCTQLRDRIVNQETHIMQPGNDNAYARNGSIAVGGSVSGTIIQGRDITYNKPSEKTSPDE